MTNQSEELLLELDGVSYVIDDLLGLWVKFEVKRVKQTAIRPHGIKYSLSLHDKFNARLMGFDNAHSISYRLKQKARAVRITDHWHEDYRDSGQPYHYVSAERLLTDFWIEVERILTILRLN
ncbi:MAG TPA: DUF6516 family protein [Coxiellaceae bacterium]|nr:DUF6516 family protein [Coxiellaceae bacterium]